MTEALLLISVGSLLAISLVTLTVAALALWHARRYVELAEERMEYLRQEQIRLLMVLAHEERQRSTEDPEQERQQPPRAQQEHHRLEQERCVRRDEGRRIERVKRELLGLSEVQQESASSLLEGSTEDIPTGGRGSLIEKAWPTQKVPRAGASPARTSRTKTSSKSAEDSPEAKRQRLAVWHPHPDDDVSPERGSTRQTRVQSDAPLKMFHRYYDRYLDNYQGYVKLAERLYMMRDRGEVPPDSAAELEWREKLRRANDGIERTTARLDLLEEYNPELATDDRVSRRASVARSHSELERRRDSVRP